MHNQKLIDEMLDRVMPKATEQPQRLHEAMRYAVFSGGKRWRPMLCLAAAEAVGGSIEQAIIPAAAIELLHTYTLVHDDLPAMDDDKLRRGKPTVHVQFDEATAILVGDALLTLAFQVMSQTQDTRLVQELAAATGSQGTIGGQYEDIQNQLKMVGENMLQYIQVNKTAKLFRVSVRLGCLSAKTNETFLPALSEYGHHLGLAYQWVDDLIDREEASMRSYGASGITKRAYLHYEKAISALSGLPGATESLQAIASVVISQIPKQS